MRESFEQNIEGYNEAAKIAIKKDPSVEDRREFGQKLSTTINAAIDNRESNLESQKQIFLLQKKKQEIMQKLKKKVALFDDPNFVPERRPEERLVVKVDDQYVVRNEENGSEEAVTKGEIITDMEWDMYYYLDPATVDRKVRKRYLIEDAKRELLELYDEQIVTDETSSGSTHWMKRDAYEKRSQKTGLETGFLAEAMVKNFLKKLSYDYDVDFDIVEANAFQDVDQKMDFIIRRKQHEKGVRVEESEALRTGVQFTTNLSPEVVEHKTHQVEQSKKRLKAGDKVEKIVLVTMPAGSIRDVYNAWNKNRKPGGPDKLWYISIKENIFHGVMEDILTPEEIEADWAKISGENESIK